MDGLWKNVEPFHIFTLGGAGEIKIRIGVISLFKAETVLNTSADLSDYVIDNYYNVAKRWIDYLRKEEKVDAFILLVHFGLNCSLEPIEKLKLKIRDKNTHQEPWRRNYDFLKKNRKRGIKNGGNSRISCSRYSISLDT